MSGSASRAEPLPAVPDVADALPRVRWQWRAFAALEAAELHAALTLRAEVFVVEQGCVFLDPDAFDSHAQHLLGWDDGPCAEPAGSAACLAAYLRVLPPHSKYPEPSIGRVITRKPYRGLGLGRVLMREGMAWARAAYPRQPIRISAQERLARFYASLGFRAVGAVYDEDGIPHVDMRLDPSPVPSPASSPAPDRMPRSG